MDGKNSVMFSKKGDEWETPKKLFDKLNMEFNFTVDVAATIENKLCQSFFDNFLDEKSLLLWTDVAWCNAPYSKIAAFTKKCYDQSLKGAIVVLLIPARTDTKYFHDYCMKAAEIRFIKGRLQFANRTLPSWRADGDFKMSSAPFPSIVVVFDEERRKQRGLVVSEMGWK